MEISSAFCLGDHMRRHVLGWAAASASVFTALPAQGAEISIGTSGTYSTGKYGSSEPSQIRAASLSASTTLDGWELSASLPYVDILVASGEELSLGGVVIRPGSGRRISGFGDVVLAAGGNLPLGDRWPVEIGIQVQAKLPTGRSSLSSGKIDAGFDVEISKSLGPVSPFLVVGRRFYGDSAELKLNDGWATSIGAAVTHRKSTFIISYDWEQSAVSLPDSRDLFLVASTAFGRDWTLTFLGSKGLSAGSADHMLGFALARSFRRGARASVRN